METIYFIQNKVTENSFEDIVFNWLIEGDYTPDDIIENIVSEKNLLYLPLIFYKMKYFGYCNATIGYQRAEDYYEWDNYNKKQIRRTRFVTDWHPYSQPVSGQTSISVLAGGENLNSISLFIEDMGWNSNDYIKLDLASTPFKYSFHISIEEGWELKGYKKSYDSAYKQIFSQLPSKNVNTFNINIDFSEIAVYKLIVPYWYFTYEYESKSYFVIVDGNSPNRISGTKPEDRKRINMVDTYRIGGWLAGILFIILCIYIYFDMEFKNFEINLESLGIIIGGIALTWSLVEYLVSNTISISKKRREKKLRQNTIDRKYLR